MKKNFMNKVIKTFLIILSSLFLISCGKEQNGRNYRIAEDGLIYKYGTNEFYTGLVIDTSDIIITFEVVNGVKNGAFITYYPNGKYEKYGMINNDQNIGEWSYFYSNGQLESIGSFKKNKPSGKWISYYRDGKIKVEGTYKDGVQDGRWSYFNSKGKLTNIFIFQNGIIQERQIKS
jgi:hypothetical protein